MKKQISIAILFLTLISLAACGGGGSPSSSNPTSEPTQTQQQDNHFTTSEEDSSTAPTATTPVDINDLTVDISAISLASRKNADGTLTYTYRDTSIKPLYSSNDRPEYSIHVSARSERLDLAPIAQTDFYAEAVEQEDGWLLDIAGLNASDTAADVTVDKNGLSITWTSSSNNGNFNNVAGFIVDIRLSLISNSGLDINEIFVEQIDFALDILQ